jgi:hypothetical protein
VTDLASTREAAATMDFGGYAPSERTVRDSVT